MENKDIEEQIKNLIGLDLGNVQTGTLPLAQGKFIHINEKITLLISFMKSPQQQHHNNNSSRNQLLDHIPEEVVMVEEEEVVEEVVEEEGVEDVTMMMVNEDLLEQEQETSRELATSEEAGDKTMTNTRIDITPGRRTYSSSCRMSRSSRHPTRNRRETTSDPRRM